MKKAKSDLQKKRKIKRHKFKFPPLTGKETIPEVLDDNRYFTAGDRQFSIRGRRIA